MVQPDLATDANHSSVYILLVTAQQSYGVQKLIDLYPNDSNKIALRVRGRMLLKIFKLSIEKWEATKPFSFKSQRSVLFCRKYTCFRNLLVKQTLKGYPASFAEKITMNKALFYQKQVVPKEMMAKVIVSTYTVGIQQNKK